MTTLQTARAEVARLTDELDASLARLAIGPDKEAHEERLRLRLAVALGLLNRLSAEARARGSN